MGKPKGIKNPNDEDLLDLMSLHFGSCDLGSHKKRGIFRTVLTVSAFGLVENIRLDLVTAKWLTIHNSHLSKLPFCFAKKKTKHFLLTFSQTLVVCWLRHQAGYRYAWARTCRTKTRNQQPDTNKSKLIQSQCTQR